MPTRPSWWRSRGAAPTRRALRPRSPSSATPRWSAAKSSGATTATTCRRCSTSGCRALPSRRRISRRRRPSPRDSCRRSSPSPRRCPNPLRRRRSGARERTSCCAAASSSRRRTTTTVAPRPSASDSSWRTWSMKTSILKPSCSSSARSSPSSRAGPRRIAAKPSLNTRILTSRPSCCCCALRWARRRPRGPPSSPLPSRTRRRPSRASRSWLARWTPRFANR
mmetsp:Transcript_25011/g.78335  ORF Transcript_25011/g.78335 Transcript_25011/m.78335 type:complete len:223 (+) Transcript_25011:1467-2135(+)